jgi:hypothetical protein
VPNRPERGRTQENQGVAFCIRQYLEILNCADFFSIEIFSRSFRTLIFGKPGRIASGGEEKWGRCEKDWIDFIGFFEAGGKTAGGAAHILWN